MPTYQDIHTILHTGGTRTQTPINQSIKINTNPDGTVIASSGQTTLDKLLATLTTNLALIKGAGYIPTTQQPQMQIPQYIQTPIGVGNTTGTGATFGDTIEQLVTQNTGLIALGVGAYLLFKSGRK